MCLAELFFVSILQSRPALPAKCMQSDAGRARQRPALYFTTCLPFLRQRRTAARRFAGLRRAALCAMPNWTAVVAPWQKLFNSGAKWPQSHKFRS